jgi:hypothetical protein
MNDNRFQRLPAKQSFNIHFTESVSLTGYTLINGPRLPDVNNQGEIKKNERLQDKDAAAFSDAFVFHFNKTVNVLRSIIGESNK